ncbi:MAG TPA: YwiC-like family protein [Kofleriaceae bacterium]
MSRRSLWPREHGAYFQLAIPLAVALAVHAPSIASAAWAAASCLAFLAHEPLLVTIGRRGPRLQSAEGSRARLRLAVLGGGAIALGIVAVVLAPTPAIAVAALSLVPVAAVIALAWRRAEHTLLGEVIAAIALTGAGAPVLVASRAAPPRALAIWLGWAAGFAASVVAVHRVMARHKRPASSVDRALAAGLIALAALCIATAARSPASLLAAPLVSFAALLVIAPPPASRLRAVGIAIASAGAASGLLVWLSGSLA